MPSGVVLSLILASLCLGVIGWAISRARAPRPAGLRQGCDQLRNEEGGGAPKLVDSTFHKFRFIGEPAISPARMNPFVSDYL